jgi:integrase
MGKRLSKGNEDWSRWYLVSEKQKGKILAVVRRYCKVDGKTVWQRYPREEYAKLAFADVEAFVVRLNGEYDQALKRAKEAYEIKHQFITEELIEEWAKHVRANQNNQVLARQIIRNVRVHFLFFFVHKLELADPVDWYQRQDEWGKALLNEKPEGMSQAKWGKVRLHKEGIVRSSAMINKVVMFSNSFIKFIHQKKPRLFPLLVFNPIPSAVLSRHDAKRNLSGKGSKRGKFVRPGDWETILAKTDPTILPFIKLAYYFGLRDAETLGVKLDDVMENYLHAQRQLVNLPNPTEPVYGPMKNNKGRKIFYWFTTPKEAYRLIKTLPLLMHPTTLSAAVSAEMKRMGLTYKMHDFRRTFITRALKAGHPQIDVRDCAGHADLQTTNLYAIRDEFFNDKRYKPDDEA